MPQETVGYVKLEWTCPKCGAKNPGTLRTCSSCGAPMPENQQFELPDQQQLVTDQKELAQLGPGPDIHCPYCGARNRSDAKTCTQCGGKLEGGTARQAGAVLGAYQSAALPDVACPHCGAMNPAAAMTCKQCGAALVRAPAAAPVAPAKSARPALPMWLMAAAAAGALLLLCGCVYFAFFRTSDAAGVVRGVAWERQIDIQEMRPAGHADWADAVPANATPGACTSKLRNTQPQPAPRATKVCGTPYTVDQGNGSGKVVQDCQYDVYADWCQFTVNEWTVVDKRVASGTDANPRWPDVRLSAGQREGSRRENYTVTFGANDKQYEYSVGDAASFARFTPGSRWTLKINALGAVVGAEPGG